MINVATVFSGIGSIEWALKRLNIEHKIVFACDNGEIDIKGIDENIIRKNVKKFKSVKEQNQYINSLLKNERKTNT